MLRSRLFWFVAAIVVLCVGLMVFSAYTGRQSALSRGIGAAVVPAQGAASGLLDGNDFSPSVRFTVLFSSN
ncbi:MAG: hypothetical protein E7423_07670 [Ruminococcaceae bacterium]|nr:hypothetical protein [Oscillospiraceae bacterium]